MNAVEFIRKFGWESAIKTLKIAKQSGYRNKYDLKRYVDAYELVESYGGADKAKIELSKQSILRWINPETEKLREAISLVEEI